MKIEITKLERNYLSSMVSRSIKELKETGEHKARLELFRNLKKKLVEAK